MYTYTLHMYSPRGHAKPMRPEVAAERRGGGCVHSIACFVKPSSMERSSSTDKSSKLVELTFSEACFPSSASE